MPAHFVLRREFEGSVRWTRRGTCENPGCADPECCCSLCGQPIGVADDDPRWIDHTYEPCYSEGCELCRDQVPLILWRGSGKQTEQAQFHQACFERLVWTPSPPTPKGDATSKG